MARRMPPVWFILKNAPSWPGVVNQATPTDDEWVLQNETWDNAGFWISDLSTWGVVHTAEAFYPFSDDIPDIADGLSSASVIDIIYNIAEVFDGSGVPSSVSPRRAAEKLNQIAAVFGVDGLDSYEEGAEALRKINTIKERLRDVTVPLSSYGSLSSGAAARETLRRACRDAAAMGKKLLIDEDITVPLVAATDPIEIPDQLRMATSPGKYITMQGFGLPLFYRENARNVIIDDINILYDGTATPSLPAATTTFRNSLSMLLPVRHIITAFGVYGGRNVTFNNPTFEATDFSHSNRFLPAAIVQNPMSSEDRLEGFSITGQLVLDGVMMGWLACGFDRFILGDVHSYHWGQLDPSVYTWTVADHAFYVTGFNDFGSRGLTTGTLNDYNLLPTTKPYTANGPFAFKLVRTEDSDIGVITSDRLAGALEARDGVRDVRFSNGNTANASSGVSADVQAGIISFGSTSPGAVESGMVEDCNFGTWDIITPPNWNDSAVSFSGSIATSGENVVPDVVRSCTGTFNVVSTATSRTPSNPMFRGRISNSTLTLNVSAPAFPNMPNPSYVLFSVDGGGYGNEFTSLIDGPSIDYLRIQETTGAGESNAFLLIQNGTLDERVLNTASKVPYPATPADWNLESGWSIVDGDIAFTAVPNSPDTDYLAAGFVLGGTYLVEYEVKAISGGSISVAAGSAVGAVRGAVGPYSDSLVAAGNTAFHLQSRLGTTPTGRVAITSVTRTA